jgi:hypothetical protein
MLQAEQLICTGSTEPVIPLQHERTSSAHVAPGQPQGDEHGHCRTLCLAQKRQSQCSLPYTSSHTTAVDPGFPAVLHDAAVSMTSHSSNAHSFDRVFTAPDRRSKHQRATVQRARDLQKHSEPVYEPSSPQISAVQQLLQRQSFDSQHTRSHLQPLKALTATPLARPPELTQPGANVVVSAGRRSSVHVQDIQQQPVWQVRIPPTSFVAAMAMCMVQLQHKCMLLLSNSCHAHYQVSRFSTGGD